MVIRSSNPCFWLYTEEPALRPPRLYDHVLPQLTSHSLSTQTWKSPSHFIILKTSLMGPPWYYDQDFMAQRWSHKRGSTVFFNFSFPHCRTKNKTKNVRQLDYGNECKELKFRPRLYEENLFRAEGSPAYPSFPGRGNVSHFSLQNMANRLNYKKLARLEGLPTLSSHPFVMVGFASYPGQRFSVSTLRAFHLTKIHVWNFGKTTCPVEGTFQLQRPNQSHREFRYRACKQDTDHWSWGK